MTSPTEALERLREGNQRFTTYGRVRRARTDEERRKELTGGQSPYAVILACADSRVAPELVFDEGLGELFVVRVAGNVLEGSQLGSIEYAVEHLGSRLVVVLGHSSCGAVAATIGHEGRPLEELSPGLIAIVGRIRTALEDLPTEGDKLDAAVRANVRQTVRQMCLESEVIKSRVAGGKVRVVGASYDLESGAVDFFDDAD